MNSQTIVGAACAVGQIERPGIGDGNVIRAAKARNVRRTLPSRQQYAGGIDAEGAGLRGGITQHQRAGHRQLRGGLQQHTFPVDEARRVTQLRIFQRQLILPRAALKYGHGRQIDVGQTTQRHAVVPCAHVCGAAERPAVLPDKDVIASGKLHRDAVTGEITTVNQRAVVVAFDMHGTLITGGDRTGIYDGYRASRAVDAVASGVDHAVIGQRSAAGGKHATRTGAGDRAGRRVGEIGAAAEIHAVSKIPAGGKRAGVGHAAQSCATVVIDGISAQPLCHHGSAVADGIVAAIRL